MHVSVTSDTSHARLAPVMLLHDIRQLLFKYNPLLQSENTNRNTLFGRVSGCTSLQKPQQ